MEKPIIFSTDMVRAIKDNKKRMTRRLIKVCGSPITSPDERLYLTEEGAIYFSVNSMSGPIKPRYNVGDILWVKETWCYGKDTHAISFDPEPLPGDILYKADIGEVDKEIVKWRPSIFMPRKAARIFLRVLNVRVERLQDITEEDAMAEGMLPFLPKFPEGRQGYRTSFKFLWNSLNEKRGYGWDTNPWVWVIEFERINK